MTSATELKTCPFCGGKAVMKHVRQIWEPRESYWAACQSCHMSGKHYRTEAEAIEAWNTRAMHGTLTAEQVMRIHEVIEKHWHDLSAEYDMPEATALPEYSYDWQAIADELNAVLGGRKVSE